MADRTFKQHDLWPPLVTVLEDDDGPIDLTNAASVKVLMKSGATRVSGRCTIAGDPTTGIVTYQWVSPDTDVAGTYDVEFEITWPSSRPETVPNSGYKSVVIEPDLG
jgi:hypothetical protein